MSATTETGARDWAEIARNAAAAREADSVSDITMKRELLTCVLAGSPYAIPVERVREIVRMRPVTPMPRTPDWVLGVISLRGEVVQVIDLRMCLDLPTADVGRSTRIIVLHGEDNRVTGVLVDGVREVLRVDPGAFRASTAAETRSVSEICKNGDEFVSVIDLDRVVGADGND
jgi:purine-binding chemotaxis protein CheW